MASPSAYPTLPIRPFEHIALDYESLRAEGLRLLGRLAGAQWTDHNATDPGVTLLEQLCYAITELAYRAAHPVPDLLAGTDPADAWPGPAEILTCDPVTSADLRKRVLDEGGVRSAVFEPEDEPEVAVYFHAGGRELRLQPDPGEPQAPPLRLAGLARLSVQSDGLASFESVLDHVAADVHAHRGLGEDVAFARIATQPVWIQARIEVGPTDDPAVLQAEILERIEAHLAPTVRFTALADAGGRPWDELFEGPALRRGLILDDLPAARRTIRTSDVIHVITDHPSVRGVRSLALATGPTAPRERWTLRLPPDTIAVLAASHDITLLRGGLPLRVDPARVQALLTERRQARSGPLSTPDVDARPAPGRDRKLARYRSLQRQFPAIYGVGPLGLPGPAPAARQAQVRQLAAYLLIFDQLLANSFEQLAHARDLLSPAVGDAPTYHAQPVDDLRLSELLRLPPAEQRAWLASLVEGAGDDPHARRKRFLAHLLARFGEQVGDYTQIGGSGEDTGQALVEDRQAFLRQISRLGGARGTGRDILADRPSGLEQRIRLKLGLRERPRFHLVEHVLLRPVPEDSRQLGPENLPQVPLLAGLDEPDPWSLQVSFVFEARPGGAPGDVFERMVADAILAETPAHLRPHLRWIDAAGDDTFDAFDAAWTAFRAALQAYRRARLAAATVPAELHLRLRDARDRVIDLLGFGRTYPLRDLPVPELLTVTPGSRAAIAIPFSQAGVVYILCDGASGRPIVRDGQPPFEVRGAGGPVVLKSPPIDKDESYRILAVKLEGRADPERRREAWLHPVVRVEEGIDASLVARLRLPLLEPGAEPRLDAARIADYRAIVEVEVLASQEGVTYDLVNDRDHTQVVSQGAVVGTSGTIVLSTRAVLEDFDVRVRGARSFGGELRTTLLDLVLPLRVRANPALTVELLPAPIVEHGAVAPRSLQPPGVRVGSTIVDPRPYEFGVKFRADVAGTITAIRFHKGAATAGAHIVSLWRGDGTSLASATVTDPPMGWNQVKLPSPVAIIPGATYVASYFAPSGGSSYTPDHFVNAGIDRAPLHAPRSLPSDGNGVANTSHVFPTGVWGNAYYWIDVVFIPEAAPPVLRLAQSQTSVEYRVFRRRIRDGEFVLDDPPPVPTLDAADGDRTIRVTRPGAAVWQELVPIGDARPGTGAALDLPLGALVEDSYLFVQAIKRHRRSPRTDDRVVSTVQLTQVRPIFVRPDRDRALLTTAWPVDGTTGDALLLRDGQPGVYYELRVADAPLGGPGYFHQRDDDDAQFNKGYGELVVGTDFALRRDIDDPGDLPRTPPPDPLVDVTRQPLGAVARVFARRAFSGVEAELSRLARFDPFPPIRAEAAAVAAGAATRIVIDSSVVGETYRLLRGEQVLATVAGTGATVFLATGPLTARTTFEVALRRDDPAALPVERRISVTVTVT